MMSRVLVETVPGSLDFELLCYIKKTAAENGKYQVEKLKLRAENERSKEEWV